MDSLGRPPSGVHAALRAASSAANAANVRDTAGLVDLLRQLKELGGELQLSKRPAESELVALGVEIAERLINRQYPAPDEFLPWLTRILAFLGVSLGIDLTDEWTSMQKPPRSIGPTAALTETLRIVESDGHRLGEILVQMSFLKSYDVERALQVQRQTNCRLGEALVLLGLITPKGLEAALKIQSRKRVPES